jgi:hypothetical protein
MKTMTPELKPARIGSVSHGTLRTEDLLSTFISELEGLMLVSGDYFSLPENRAERDRLCSLIGEAQDCFAEDGETIEPDKGDIASELVNETLIGALQTFALPYCYFGTHPGDGSDFGFWPSDIEDIKEQVEFCSHVDKEYPDDDFIGEWLHINERGNCTLYLRENGTDKEIWSLV